MNIMSVWRHCQFLYYHKPGTGPIPGLSGPIPRASVRYMDTSDPFEKQFSDVAKFEDIMKWFGSNGWELAAVSGSDGIMTYYFKRAERLDG